MKKFIFASRNGIHILDLTKTLTQIQIACGFIHEVVTNGGTVLFVGTKKQAQQEVRDASAKTGMPYVVDRWLGGTLTNLRTIRKSVKRMQDIDRELIGPDANLIPKKEQANMRRDAAKLHRNLDGIVNMEHPPSAMFVIDLEREEIAIREAQRLGVPIIAIVDTNCDPDEATYPIAGNDDAIRSVKLITAVIADAIAEAQAELGKKQPIQQEAEVTATPEPVAEVPALVEQAPA